MILNDFTMSRIKIGSKYRENLERLKKLVKLAVGSSSLEDFLHIYSDSERKIIVEPLDKAVNVSVFYKSGLLEKEIYTISYSKLIKN